MAETDPFIDAVGVDVTPLTGETADRLPGASIATRRVPRVKRVPAATAIHGIAGLDARLVSSCCDDRPERIALALVAAVSGHRSGRAGPAGG